MRGVVLAGAGRSINLVDVHEPGWPVAAISSGVRCIDGPSMWFALDNIRMPYFGTEGQHAANDTNVEKILPAGRLNGWPKGRHAPPNTRFVEVATTYAHFRPEFMDSHGSIMNHPHKSIAFAVQVLIRDGYDKLIFAGCDCDDVYAHGRELNSKGRARLLQGHQKVVDALQAWHGIAMKRGVEFVSMTPVGPLNSFMRYYDVQKDSTYAASAAQGNFAEAAA